MCHAGNSRSAGIPRLLKRVLDVGVSHVQNVQPQQPDKISAAPSSNIRLCDAKTLSAGVQYVTLSHCWGYHPTVAWGRHPAITLTNDLLDAFYMDVPLFGNTSPESLTFKHAVRVVRDLGYQYLWIDALCINQDDPEEKALQISIMDDIYSNAAFNVSATASSSGSGGLIHSKHPLSTEPVRSSIRLPSGEEGEMIIYANRWRQEIDEGSVNSRAWVFQERILAPHVVHFTRDQIFWECASMKAAQSFPRGMPHGVQSFFDSDG